MLLNFSLFLPLPAPSSPVHLPPPFLPVSRSPVPPRQNVSLLNIFFTSWDLFVKKISVKYYSISLRQLELKHKRYQRVELDRFHFSVQTLRFIYRLKNNRLLQNNIEKDGSITAIISRVLASFTWLNAKILSTKFRLTLYILMTTVS